MKVFHNPETNELAIESDPGSDLQFLVLNFNLNSDVNACAWKRREYVVNGTFKQVFGFDYDNPVRERVIATLRAAPELGETIEDRADNIIKIVEEAR